VESRPLVIINPSAKTLVYWSPCFIKNVLYIVILDVPPKKKSQRGFGAGRLLIYYSPYRFAHQGKKISS
jgi:hypothetical protein